MSTYELPSRYSDRTRDSRSDSTVDRHATSERSSSEEMTWLTGSQTVEPGITSSSVGSPSPAAPAGVEENETYPLSGVCLLRVAVLTAVMICRVMQSSAKLRKDDSRSERKSRIAL